VRLGKPWRQGLPDCYVERLDALKHYYCELCVMRPDLLSNPESEHLTHERPSLSGLSEGITAAIALLKWADDKVFKLLPTEEFAAN
jgi:hypothetical protein